MKLKTIIPSIFIHLLWAPFAFGIPMTITCGPHKIHLEVEQATTNQARQIGLMHRPHLPEDQGMLFSYDSPQSVAMWMKNTLISLDMIFYDETGQILEIYENAVPHSLANIGPVENTSHVLEINGGLVKKLGISKRCTLKLDG